MHKDGDSTVPLWNYGKDNAAIKPVPKVITTPAVLGLQQFPSGNVKKKYRLSLNQCQIKYFRSDQ